MESLSNSNLKGRGERTKVWIREIGIKKQRVLFFFLFFFLLKCLQNLEKIFQYTWETYSRTSYLCQNSKNFEKINQNLKERSIVIMASLLVRNVEKFELQRESSWRYLKIRSNYINSRITGIRITGRKLQEFLKKISRWI